jgi:SAM-dependent methyltransferase
LSEDSGFQVGASAPSYYESHVARFMAPFIEVLVGATVMSGQSVLDVACGTGLATRAAATAAGSGALVEGSDLNPAMLAQAQVISDDIGAQIRWSEASALALPHADQSFDTVICQQGLQFFPDPGAGIREMARVTRDGGRIGVTVWSADEPSPFIERETQMLARYGGGAQAEYAVAIEQLSGWFDDGRVDDASIELITADVDLPPVLTYVPKHLKALPWSASFFDLPAEQQLAALHELDAELAQYRIADGLRIPFSSYLATATVRH